jgi:hypothetical protein
MMCGLSKPPFPLVAQPAAVIASDHRPGESRAKPIISPSLRKSWCAKTLRLTQLFKSKPHLGTSLPAFSICGQCCGPRRSAKIGWLCLQSGRTHDGCEISRHRVDNYSVGQRDSCGNYLGRRSAIRHGTHQPVLRSGCRNRQPNSHF